MGSSRRFDVLLLALTLVAVLCAVLSPLPLPLRALGALPLVLVLPGYWLTAAAFGDAIGGVELRGALSVGFSIAICVISGLLLNLTPAGLTTNGFILALGGVSLLGSGVAWLRGRRAAAESPPLRTYLPSRRGGILFALAGALLVGAFGLAQISAARQNRTDFTQLWIVPDAAAPDHSAQLGVRNQEADTRVYALELRINGDLAHEWRPITLAPQQTWQVRINAPNGIPFQGNVEALLYREDEPGKVYRRVLLRVAS